MKALDNLRDTKSPVQANGYAKKATQHDDVRDRRHTFNPFHYKSLLLLKHFEGNNVRAMKGNQMV